MRLFTRLRELVDEIRTARFARRFRRSPLLRDLEMECRWRRWQLTESGCPEPDEGELAAYLDGELPAERADEVMEWASISRRVGDRLLEMVRERRADGRST